MNSFLTFQTHQTGLRQSGPSRLDGEPDQEVRTYDRRFVTERRRDGRQVRRGRVDRPKQHHLLQDRRHVVEKESVLLSNLLCRCQHGLRAHHSLRAARDHQRLDRPSPQCQTEAGRHRRVDERASERDDRDDDDDSPDRTQVDDSGDDVGQTKSLCDASHLVDGFDDLRDSESESSETRNIESVERDSATLEPVGVRARLGKHLLHRLPGHRRSDRRNRRSVATIRNVERSRRR